MSAPHPIVDLTHPIADGRVTTAELVAELADRAARYPVVSFEDPVAEADRDGWKLATEELPASSSWATTSSSRASSGSSGRSSSGSRTRCS